MNCPDGLPPSCVGAVREPPLRSIVLLIIPLTKARLRCIMRMMRDRIAFYPFPLPQENDHGWHSMET